MPLTARTGSGQPEAAVPAADGRTQRAAVDLGCGGALMSTRKQISDAIKDEEHGLSEEAITQEMARECSPYT
jgi:hypothetical protein